MNPLSSSSFPPTTVPLPHISSIIAPTLKKHNKVLDNFVLVPHNFENGNSTNVYLLDTGSNAVLQNHDDPPSTMVNYKTSSSTTSSPVDAPHVINAHSMMNRSKCGIFKPKAYLVDYTQHEPCDVNEALKHPH